MSERTKKLPETLSVELMSLFPRWICYVFKPQPDGKGFFKGFKTHRELYDWLSKHNYVFQAPAPKLPK